MRHLSVTLLFFSFFFFTATPTTEIYTLSLHDALPISVRFAEAHRRAIARAAPVALAFDCNLATFGFPYQNVARLQRSEEHTSELQSPMYLVCRLLLEKKKKKKQKKHKSNKI